MKKCASCGSENLDVAKFCDSCGGKLEQAPAIPAHYPAAAPAVPAAPAPPARDTLPTAYSGSVQAWLKADVSGREFMLDPGREAVIGRGDRARGISPDIELADSGALAQGVSRLHAKVIYREGSFYLIDLNSTNSTYINGNKLVPQQPYSLRHGDRIELGNYSLVFSLPA